MQSREVDVRVVEGAELYTLLVAKSRFHKASQLSKYFPEVSDTTQWCWHSPGVSGPSSLKAENEA